MSEYPLHYARQFCVRELLFCWSRGVALMLVFRVLVFVFLLLLVVEQKTDCQRTSGAQHSHVSFVVSVSMVLRPCMFVLANLPHALLVKVCQWLKFSKAIGTWNKQCCCQLFAGSNKLHCAWGL